MNVDTFRNELSKIPEQNIYNKNLKELWELTKKNKYENKELHDLYFEKACLVTPFFYPLNPIDLNKFEFIRCRAIDDKKENINLISTFSYPPPTICDKNGRANIIGNPVFYCTDHPATAIYESKPEKDKTNYISIWKCIIDRELKIIPIISPSIPESNPWYFLAEEIVKTNNIQVNISKLLRPLYEFSNKVYLKETAPYQLSSWISNYLLYQNDNFDALLYESVASKSLQCNWAFHPNIVDMYFFLDRVYKFENITFDETTKSFINPDEIASEVGEVTNKNIVWRKFQNNDLLDFPFTREKMRKSNFV